MTRLWKGIPSPFALRNAAGREMNELAEQLAQAVPGQSVHGARRRIKQLRSQLRLMRPVLGDEAFAHCNAALRMAAGVLAGQRRAEALALAAQRLDCGFWQRLAEDHRLAHATVQNPEATLAAARKAILGAAQRLDDVALVPVEGALETAFLANYAKARRRLRRALGTGEAVALHEARKYVIHHLHHLKLLNPDGKHRLAALERLREVLGELNDLAELEELAAHAGADKIAARRMRKARRKLLVRARKAEGRLFRRRSRAWKTRFGHAGNPSSLPLAAALQACE